MENCLKGIKGTLEYYCHMQTTVPDIVLQGEFDPM